MLGWHISVYRQTNGGSEPAVAGADRSQKLAVWQSGLLGVEWLDALVQASDAIYLGGNGGPSQYTARAKYINPALVPKPPHSRDAWFHDHDDILTDKWIGKTFIDTQAIEECSAEEWLLIVAWDEG